MKIKSAAVSLILLAAMLLLSGCGKQSAAEITPEPTVTGAEAAENTEENAETESAIEGESAGGDAAAKDDETSAKTPEKEQNTELAEEAESVLSEKENPVTEETAETDAEPIAETAATSVEEEEPAKAETEQEPAEQEPGTDEVTAGNPTDVVGGETKPDSAVIESEAERNVELAIPAEYAEPSYPVGEVKWNGDGSVTYFLTEDEYETLLSEVHTTIQEELNTMCEDRFFPNVDSMTANEDCTVFTVVVTSIRLSKAEQTSIPRLYELGRLYAAYCGNTSDSIRIDYMTKIGNTFVYRDSSWDHWTGELNY